MIYLDNQATTALDPTAWAAMKLWLTEQRGNPHAANRYGREAAATVEVARARVLKALEVEGGRLVFTSGATEAANWAILGGVTAMAPRNVIVTVATEHSCVLETARFAAARHGCELRVLGVGADGLIDLSEAAAAIDERVAIVAVMSVNNEIGVMQPVEQVGALAKAAGALFFCDAAQGYGRVGLPIETADLFAMSAHKIYGPAGIGALWLRDGVTLPPLLHGGGQQDGLRPGTLPVALCAGFGVAAEQADLVWENDDHHAWALWNKLVRGLGPEWRINGSVEHRWFGNLSVRRDGVNADRLISEVREVAFSAGSACASGTGQPSHVLRALGLSDAEARSTIRLGIGRFNTDGQVEEAAALINAAAERQLAWA